MNKFSPTRFLRIIYPYWVISKVLILVLSSLIFLILHESMRFIRVQKMLGKREPSYVNRTN